MPLGFAFGIQLRKIHKDGTSEDLLFQRFPPIVEGFLYALVDFDLDFYLKLYRDEFKYLSLFEDTILKNKFISKIQC